MGVADIMSLVSGQNGSTYKVDENFNTILSPVKEAQFQNWFTTQKDNGVIHPMDNGFDYDWRGYYADNMVGGSAETHFVDTYKKPWHETFSNESRYAVGEFAKYAGSWNGNTFAPPKVKYQLR